MLVRVQLRFSDLDAFGHVNHARLIGLCEEHRTAMIDLLDREDREIWADGGFVVARVEADFRAAVPPEVREIEIAGTPSRIGRTSFGMRYVLTAVAGVVAEIDEVLVAVREGQPRPLTDLEHRWIASMAD